MSPVFVGNDGKLDWRSLGYHARSAFAVVLSLVILVGGGWFVYAKANEAWIDFRSADDYLGEGKDPVAVVVPTGATVTQIGDILVENGVVKSVKAFRKAAQDNPDSNRIQAGRYNLLTELPARLALEMLLDPANLEIVQVTIPEGMTLGQQWTIINRKFGIPREDMAAAVNSGQLKLPEWTAGRYEGFMFPDTYQVAEPVNALQIAQSQATQFSTVVGELEIETEARLIGQKPYDVITVASIIEREVSRDEDRPKVAAAIYNRLAKGMKLQVDSTIHYALGIYDRVTTTAADRKVDSPYNTYLYAGLPPGAISNPGKAAITAALHPADGDWLYWTTVNLDTGETLFASDEKGHAENVAKFQAWCQANTGRC